MMWNISGELISMVFLIIIWFYSRKGHLVPNLKNRIFSLCILVTFGAVGSNVLSTLLLENYRTVPLLLNQMVAVVYFLTMPCMGLMYCLYTISIIFEYHPKLLRIIACIAAPFVLYMFIALSSPFTGLIFRIDLNSGYSQGPWIMITYWIFYLYCLINLFASRWRYSPVDPTVRRILTAFPFIAVSVILIQSLFPEYILTGTAATSALLIIYLYLQNRQLSMDNLTGLANRQEFLKMLELQMRRNQPFTVLVVSLRGFRRINSKYGQQFGNLLLQNFSRFLNDISKKNPLFRFGGDEFAILISGRIGEGDTISSSIRRIQNRLSSPWEIGTFSSMLYASIALVNYPNSCEDFNEFVNIIEYTVVQAKKEHSQSYCYCTQEMVTQFQRKNRIIEILREKVAQNSLILYYQPIYATDTNCFSSAESLLRIPDSPIGPIYPTEFIPIAEDTGLIVEMTYQIIDKVCKYIRSLMDAQVEIDSIAVNFSAVQFTQLDLASRMLAIIDSNHIPYSKIKIEITESVLSGNFAAVSAFIDEMHQKGIHFGLDDFGTGYSNISSVLTIPLDVIKLDKSLVWSAITNKKSSAMARHITHAFMESGMKVLAEGVETQEQSQFVQDCGCQFLQGYLYAKPIPGSDAAKILGTSYTASTASAL